MPSVNISDDLYRALQRIAVPFEDTSPEDAIWRLVKERGADYEKPPAESNGKSGGLKSAGALIPNGSQLKFQFRGQELPAEVRNGRIWVNGKAFTSPSRAATEAAEQLGFSKRSLNGWYYWQIEARGQWRPIGEVLRQMDYRRGRRR